jgi:hypothetical protein
VAPNRIHSDTHRSTAVRGAHRHQTQLPVLGFELDHHTSEPACHPQICKALYHSTRLVRLPFTTFLAFLSHIFLDFKRRFRSHRILNLSLENHLHANRTSTNRKTKRSNGKKNDANPNQAETCIFNLSFDAERV